MEKYLNDTVKTIQELIRIDSTNQPAEEGMPFGKGAARALQAFLSCAAAMGFETRNYDNYVGEVLFGEGEPFAILAHLDVVPAGSGWTHAPFGGEIENGKLYGRGAMDDKGPAVVCLYALKALKDEGFTNCVRAGHDFEKAIAVARALAAPGGNVLLSPACASFDMFTDYEARGREFKRIVKDLEPNMA